MKKEMCIFLLSFPCPCINVVCIAWLDKKVMNFFFFNPYSPAWLITRKQLALLPGRGLAGYSLEGHAKSTVVLMVC